MDPPESIMKIIETSRLILREFLPSDVDAIALVLSDPIAMRYYPAPFGLPEVEEWIARNMRRYSADGHGLWAMVLKESGEIIGDCGLAAQDVDGDREVEIGYHVRRDLWGRGLATEAAQACREHGFAKLPVSQLISLIRPENLQSRRVAEKNSMTVIKETTRAGFLHLVYAIAREKHRQLA